MLTDELLISQFSLMSIHIIQEEALAKAAAAKAKGESGRGQGESQGEGGSGRGQGQGGRSGIQWDIFWGEPTGKPMGKQMGYFWDISIGILFIQRENQWVSMNLERDSQYAADAAVACSFWDATSLADRMVYII